MDIESKQFFTHKKKRNVKYQGGGILPKNFKNFKILKSGNTVLL